MQRALLLLGKNRHPDAIGIDIRNLLEYRNWPDVKNLELKAVVYDFIHAIAKGTGFMSDDSSVLDRTRVLKIPDALVGLPYYSSIGPDFQWLAGTPHLKKGQKILQISHPDPDKPFTFCILPQSGDKPPIAFIRRLRPPHSTPRTAA